METVGGWFGHYFRRLIHLVFIPIPIIYYEYAASLLREVHLSPPQFLWIVMGVNALFEIIRIRCGWLMLGHRLYERKQISALAWGIFSVACLLLLSPGGYAQGIRFALPIAAALALADPVMGEMRLHGAAKWAQMVVGLLVVALVWQFAVMHFHVWWGYVLLMPPVVVACELPRIKWVDDNALMLLIPLAIVLVLS